MKVTLNTWNNDFTRAQELYKKDEKAELITIGIEADDFQATKTLSVAEAEELVNELSDHIRWIKEA